jgi:hypothetical protein
MKRVAWARCVLIPLLLCGLTGCPAQDDGAAGPAGGSAVAGDAGLPAELILTNARVHTMNPVQPRADTVVIDDGRIVALTPAGISADTPNPALGRERVDRTYPIGFLERSGAIIVGGSDWNVSSPNPLEAIQFALSRRDPTGAIDAVPVAMTLFQGKVVHEAASAAEPAR